MSEVLQSVPKIRFCPKCKIETERTNSDACRLCKAAYLKTWRATNSEKFRLKNAAYKLANPEKFKRYAASAAAKVAANPKKESAKQKAWRASNPEKLKARSAAYYAVNKDHMNANKRAWRALRTAIGNNKEREYSAAWHKAHPEVKRISEHNRRALIRKDGGRLSSGLADKLFKLQKGKCPCCKQPLGEDYHLDHIHPISLGGANTDSNIQLLRAKCNISKKARHSIAFMQSRGFLL